MKTDQSQKNCHFQLQKINLLKNQFQEKTIICSKGKVAPYVYMNRKCNQYPFVCQQNQCQCHLKHNKCIKTEIKMIIKNLMQSQFSYHDIQHKVQTIFDKAIDLLSSLRESLLFYVKQNQKSYEYIGLSSKQIKFINSLKEVCVDKIECQNVWEILMSSNEQIQISEILRNFEDKINQLWVNLQKQVYVFSQFMQKQLKLINKYKVQHFQKSKIVKTPQDQFKLLNFFQNKCVKQASLLYHASDNDFEIQKFHQKCDHISHTVTICQTQFGKVIGAYSVEEWYKSQKWQFFKDSQGQSFVFSLTNGDKFINDNNQGGIVRRNDNTFGLQFGKNLQWDFLLANKANQNDRSLANINTGYKNHKYKKGDKHSFQKFIGNPNGYTFRVNQWEVWKIQFDL